MPAARVRNMSYAALINKVDRCTLLVDSRTNQLRETEGEVAAMTPAVPGLHPLDQPTSSALTLVHRVHVLVEDPGSYPMIFQNKQFLSALLPKKINNIF